LRAEGLKALSVRSAAARGGRSTRVAAVVASLLWLAIASSALAAGAASASSIPPKPARYVTDVAGVLDASRAEALNARLEQLEKETSIQMLVWVDRRLPENTSIEEFAVM